MSTFSVVIPSFNGKEFLRKTLLALKKSNLQPLRCIAVDDFSSDGTFEMLKRDFPEVATIRNEKNLGPTASRNRGAEQAKGKYLIFLDNDVLAEPDAIEKLIEFSEYHQNVGVVGGKLLNDKGEATLWNKGRIKIIGTEWVRESFFLVPLDIFKKVGGFDERFFMFFEGPDLSERLMRLGYKTYFCDAAKAVILENHTHSRLWRKVMFNLSWSRFHLKHLF